MRERYARPQQHDGCEEHDEVRDAGEELGQTHGCRMQDGGRSTTQVGGQAARKVIYRERERERE